MKEIKRIIYKGMEIVISVNTETGYFHTSCLHMKSYNDKISHCGYETMKEAIEDVTKKIDSFLETVPSSWEELAQELTNSLCWHGYEDAYVDVEVLKTIVTNFLTKVKNDRESKKLVGEFT